MILERNGCGERIGTVPAVLVSAGACAVGMRMPVGFGNDAMGIVHNDQNMRQ